MATTATLDALMEDASRALAEMDYLTCESLCLKALAAAREDGNWAYYKRILLPLQEVRRQRRMIAADGDVVLGCTGGAMISDHRRILATAVGRIRGKLKYRPVIFEFMPPEFTLLALQRTVEAIVGFPCHKQNFRRSVEAGGLVERTSRLASGPSGRPAALFRASDANAADRAALGLSIPRLKKRPSFDPRDL